MRNEDISITNGSALLEPAGPVVANSTGSFRITYTAGPDGIMPGGSVRFEIPYGFTAPQYMWWHDPGYVSAVCSRRGVRLQLSLEPPVKLEPQPFYYVTRYGRMVYVQVLEQALQEGDTIVLEYGRRPAMSPGVTVQHFAQTVEFTVATDVDGARSGRFSGYTLIAQQPALTVVGDELDSLRVTAPSYVQVGEGFPVRVVGLDEAGNLASEAVVDVLLMTGEDEPQAPKVEEVGPGLSFEARFDVAGEKLLAVSDFESQVMGVSNPIICLPQAPELNLYWGDIHGHTVLSDGLGSADGYYEFGRDEALLDFCAIADHAQYLGDEDWEQIKDSTRRFNEPGRFVTLLGYEYSCNANLPRYGDKCLYYPGDEGPLLRETDINRSGYQDMAEFAPTWKEHGAMMVLHQHARGTCTYYDPDLVRLAEVYSIWGGSESSSTARPLLPSLEHDYSGHYVADALAQGWILGFIGSSDDHGGRPGATDWLRLRQAYPGGLVAVWAPELTRESLWQALWNRHCYATSGARILLRFTVDGAPMGSIIKGSAFSRSHKLEVEVHGDAKLALVEVLRGREIIHAITSYNPSAHLEIVDTPPPGAANYYYVRVTQRDQEMAWSSPVWVQ